MVSKMAASSYAGYAKDLIRNPDFTAEVEAAYPKDTKLLLVCGDGLRSLVAAQTLTTTCNFTNVAWLFGGLHGSRDQEALKSAGTEPEVGYKVAPLDEGARFAIQYNKFWGKLIGGYTPDE